MSQRINILHLCASLSVGGAERLLLNLAEHIDRDRFAIHLCSLGVLAGNALQPDFERLALPVYVAGARRFYDARAVAAVARYVRRHEIDIIHTHLSNADIVGRVVGRWLDRPVVSTMHSVPANYDREGRGVGTLERLSARHLASQLIAVSPRVRALFVREWRIPEARITSIYNAVPTERYLSIPAELPGALDGEPLITTVGRLSPVKAQDVLLKAAALVLRQRPDARFMIVGQGRCEQALKAQAQALGVAGRVTFAGLRRDIPAVLAQSDIFALSSIWEGLPLTAIEAMAAARPVVLTDVGGARDLVEPGVQGLLVPPSDAAALAEALLALLNDRQGRVAMGRAARERVRHDFSMDVFTAQHQALYESILDQRRGMGRRTHLSAES